MKRSMYTFRILFCCLAFAAALALTLSLAACSNGGSSGSYMTTDEILNALDEENSYGDDSGAYYDEDGSLVQGDDGTEMDWSDWRNVVTAPAFTGTDIAGNAVNYKNEVGKAILVSFLSAQSEASAEACRAIQQLQDESGGTSAIFVISVFDDEPACKAFYADYSFSVLPDPDGSISATYNALPDPYDDAGTLDENPEPFAVAGLPVFFVIDGDGDVYQIVEGAADFDTLQEYMYDIEP